MTKVITYGSYDMLHYGHIRLLKRAKELGDYLIVGVTSDDYDKSRGKINIQQPLIERVKAIRELGLADEIIVEEYEGQKIDDIRKYDIDIFAIGSDWKGKFDYLNQYCKVIYLERTEGISSSEIRTRENKLRMGFAGDAAQEEFIKYLSESEYVNGLEVSGIYSTTAFNETGTTPISNLTKYYSSFHELLLNCDAVYLAPHPAERSKMIEEALKKGKHVLCKSPVAAEDEKCQSLYSLSKQQNLVLMDAIKTGYSTAFNRLLLLAAGGRIGKVVSIDASCTSLSAGKSEEDFRHLWNSIESWGPIVMLPVFQLLGTDYKDIKFICKKDEKNSEIDNYTEIIIIYEESTATLKIGSGVKTENDLVISGTEGYIYVPAPWWKTDYFEIRYEDPQDNRRYFYQLDGEGIRYELVAFIKEINESRKGHFNRIDASVSAGIAKTIGCFYRGNNTVHLL